MSYETYYEYDENINLDKDSLFNYVKYTDQLNDLMGTPGPTNPDKFGTPYVEPFKGSDQNDDEKNTNEKNTDKKNNYFIMYILIGVLLLFFLYFLFFGKFKCGSSVKPQLDVDTLNPLSADMGSGYRAVFVK